MIRLEIGNLGVQPKNLLHRIFCLQINLIQLMHLLDTEPLQNYITDENKNSLHCPYFDSVIRIVYDL